MNTVPGGVWFKQTPNGFLLRALCISFAESVQRVVLAVVVSSLPFVLWWELIRDLWTYEGLNFWFTLFFLAVWTAGIGYADILALMALFGEIRITKNNDQGEIFTGIGKVGLTHRFTWSEFQGLRRTDSCLNIELISPTKSYIFGWQLPDLRQSFIVTTLREHVYPDTNEQNKTGECP
jgi:hypothetical protein